MLNAFANKSIPRFYNTHVSAHRAWWGTAIATACTAIGMFLESIVDHSVPEVNNGPAMFCIGLASFLFLILLLRRSKPSTSMAVWFFIVNGATVTAALYYINGVYAQLDRLAIPFEPTKLGCLLVGILAPSFFSGTATIAMLAGSAVVQWMTFSPLLQEKIAFGEPYATLAFAMTGFGALVYRLRVIALTEEYERLKAEAAAVRHFAGVFLRVRDLMNTPLQVLEFSSAHLKGANAHRDLAFESIERALKHLKELNSMLKQYEDKIEWGDKPGSGPAFPSNSRND